LWSLSRACKHCKSVFYRGQFALLSILVVSLCLRFALLRAPASLRCPSPWVCIFLLPCLLVCPW
jgi:hypothetical protein